MSIQRTEAMEPRKYRLVNRRSEVLTLVLEPWANEYAFSPGDTMEIVEEGPVSSEPLEIHFEATHVIVYGRTGTFLSLFRNGVEEVV